jgi:hypothetical protein
MIRLPTAIWIFGILRFSWTWLRGRQPYCRLLLSIHWSSHSLRTSFRRPIAMCVSRGMPRTLPARTCETWVFEQRRIAATSLIVNICASLASCCIGLPQELIAEISGSLNNRAHARAHARCTRATTVEVVQPHSKSRPVPLDVRLPNGASAMREAARSRSEMRHAGRRHRLCRDRRDRRRSFLVSAGLS